jgi:transmembrane sensor
MSSARNLDTTQRRAEAAIDWLLRLSENPQDDALLADWLDWCGGDDENLIEFRRACDLWNAFGSKEVEALLAAATRPAMPLRPLSADLPRPAVPSRPRRRGLRRAGAVAATLLLGVTAAFFVQQQIENAGREIHATPIAQHDTDLLADGSRLEIGAASRVTSRYSEQRREIEVQEGEAFFEVAHDAERPFVVRAGEVRIRAVGTAFNVRRGATRTVVTVSEGAVEVLFKHWYDLFTPAGERRTLARAGEQAVYDRSTGRLHTEAVDTEAATAWRRDSRSFSFLNEPLADVVAYVNRYSERKIVIADDVLARRTFTGSVHHDRGKDWLRALERAYPLRVQQAEDGAIRLVPTDRTLAGQG